MKTVFPTLALLLLTYLVTAQIKLQDKKTVSKQADPFILKLNTDSAGTAKVKMPNAYRTTKNQPVPMPAYQIRPSLAPKIKE